MKAVGLQCDARVSISRVPETIVHIFNNFIEYMNYFISFQYDLFSFTPIIRSHTLTENSPTKEGIIM